MGRDAVEAKDVLYKELTELIEKLVKTYRLLLDTVRKEKDLLIEVNIDELNENNKAKEVAIRKLRILENDRIRIVREMSKNLRIKNEPIRLLDIANALQGREADELRNKHSVLDLLIKRVMELNQQNESLAQTAIKNVSGAIGAIKDGLQDKATYERKGEVKSGKGQGGHLVSRQV